MPGPLIPLRFPIVRMAEKIVLLRASYVMERSLTAAQAAELESAVSSNCTRIFTIGPGSLSPQQRPVTLSSSTFIIRAGWRVA